MLLSRLAGLLFLGFIAPSYSQSAPTGVRVTVDEVPRTITGRVTISWTAPVPAPDTYTVTVSPLNYVDTLQDPVNSGFVFSSGDAPSQVSVIGTPPTAGGVSIQTHAGHLPYDNGRGQWPLMLRKPSSPNATVTVEMDCTSGTGGAPNFVCGVAVYDAASNSTLFIVGLSNRGGVLAAEAFAPGFTPSATATQISDGTTLASAATQVGGGAWGGGDVSISLTRSLSGTGWAATVAQTSALGAGVSLAFPDTDIPARAQGVWPAGEDTSLWHAATLGGWGGSSTPATLSATVKKWGLVEPIRNPKPPTLLGTQDVCVAPGGVSEVVTSGVTGTSLYLTGLSGSFPYTVSVMAYTGGAPSSPASAPLPGVWFWARHMPPRAHMLGMWANSRVFSGMPAPTGGFTYTSMPVQWPDSSGRGNHLRQPLASARPTFGDTQTGYYNFPDPYSYNRVSFARGAGQNMMGRRDNLDLGITGDFTAYVMYRGTSSTPQVIVGKGGAPASTVFGTPASNPAGWAQGVYPTTFNPNPGWSGISVSDGGVSSPIYPGVAHWTYGYSSANWQMIPPMYTTTATTLGAPGASVLNFTMERQSWAGGIAASQGLAITTANAANVGPITGGATGGVNPNVPGNNLPKGYLGNFSTVGGTGVSWVRGGGALSGGGYTGAPGSAPYSTPSSPPTAIANYFRLGGPTLTSAGAGNPQFAFSGDIYQVLLYREAHTPSQRAAISAWVANYTFESTCGGQSLLGTAPGVSSTDGYGGALPNYCSGSKPGVVNTNCWQGCSGAGFVGSGGAWWGRNCVGGAWNAPPLVCSLACSNAQAPLYAGGCTRTLLNDTLAPLTYPGTMGWVVEPATMPIAQQKRTWVSVPPGTPGAVTNAYGGTGGYLQANPGVFDTCAGWVGGRPTSYGPATTYWRDYTSGFIPWGVKGYVSVFVALAGATSSGGLAVRSQSINAHYRAVISLGGGLVLQRVNGGVAVTLTRGFANATVLPPPAWNKLDLTYLNGYFTVALNGELALVFRDSALPFYAGPPTLFANASLGSPDAVLFNGFSVSSDCDAYNSANNVLSGMSVTHSCLVGYTPIGNATRQCRRSPPVSGPGSAPSYTGNGLLAVTVNPPYGSYDSPGLLCLSQPPTFLTNASGGAFVFSVLDRAPNGTTIGTAAATPANPNQVLTYSIVRVTPTCAGGGGPACLPSPFFNYSSTLGNYSTPSTPLLSIVSCSGVIRVFNPLALDSVFILNLTVLVSVVPDGQTQAAAFTNVSIWLIPVPRPPTILPIPAPYPDPSGLSVREAYVGPINGTIPFENHNSLPLRWSLIQPSTQFAIHPTTGVISVLPPGLSFAEAVAGSPPGGTPTGGQYQLGISLADARNPNFGTVASISIDVIDVDSPPVQGNYTFFVLPTGVTPGALVGGLVNGDEDALTEGVAGTATFAPPPSWLFSGATITSGARASVIASYMNGWLPPDAATPGYFTFDTPTVASPGAFPTYNLLLNPASPPATLAAFASGSVFAYQAPGSTAIYLASAAVQLTLASTSPSGSTYASGVTVVFMNTNYSSTVQVTNALPSQGVPTTGGTVIAVSFSGLNSATVDLNISIGSALSPGGSRNCPLVTDGGGLTPVSRGDPGGGNTWAQAYLGTYPSPLTLPPPISSSSTWTVYCIAPPGEGTAPVTIQYSLSQAPTLVLSSGEGGGTPTITYLPPSVSGLSAWSRADSNSSSSSSGGAPGSFTVCPYNPSVAANFPLGLRPTSPTPAYACGNALVVPPSMLGALQPVGEGGGGGQLLRTARIEGTNFGVCPILSFVLPSGAVRSTIATCGPGAEQPAGSVTHGPDFIEFPAPEGVGSGWGVGAAGCPSPSPDGGITGGCGPGWSVTLTVGGVSTPPMPLIFLPPVITSITPSSGATTGGVSLTITGDFLGPSWGVPPPGGSLGWYPVSPSLPPWAANPCVYLGYASPASIAAAAAAAAASGGTSASSPYLTTFPATPPTYSYSSGACTPVPNSMACTRSGPDTLTCTSPNGAGARLDVVVWADAVVGGVGAGLFSYAPPVLTSICLGVLTGASASPSTWATPSGYYGGITPYTSAGSFPPPPTYTTPTPPTLSPSCLTPSSPPDAQLTLLPLPAPNDILVFTGSSLGPPIAADCAFAAWAPTLSSCLATGAPLCPATLQSDAPCCRVGADGTTPWAPSGGQGLNALQCLSFPPPSASAYEPPPTSTNSSSPTTPTTPTPTTSSGGGVSLEDFPGEGQVAPRDVLYWSDTLVVIRAPPGMGQRLVTLRVTGQAPSPWPSETSLNARYSPPTISGPLAVSFGGGSTLGGGTAYIPTTHAPRMPYTEWFNVTLSAMIAAAGPGVSSEGGGSGGNSTIPPVSPAYAAFAASGLPLSGYLSPSYPSLYLSLPLPLFPPGLYYNASQNTGWAPATETAVVWLGTHCLAPPSAATDGIGAGALASALSALGCSFCSPSSTGGGVGCVRWSDERGVSITVPPGVGRAKPVRVGYLSARDNGVGGNISLAFPANPAYTFSYSPPAITSMGTLNPSTQSITQPVVYGGSSAVISVTGINFGVPVYSGPGAWTAGELVVGVGVAGAACASPARGYSSNPAIGNYVYCTLLASDLANMAVGFNAASITIGAPPSDQTGVLPVGAPNSLYIACAGGALPTTLLNYGAPGTGSFGLVGQVCLPCPVGALCPGYQEDPPPLVMPSTTGGGGGPGITVPAVGSSTPAASIAPIANPCGLGAGALTFVAPSCLAKYGNVSSRWVSPCCLDTDPTTPAGALFYTRALPPVPTNYTSLWNSWQGALLGGGSAATWAGQVVAWDPLSNSLSTIWPLSPPERRPPSAIPGTGGPAAPTSRLQYDRILLPLPGGAVATRTISHSLPIPQPGFFNLNGSMAALCPPTSSSGGAGGGGGRPNVCIVACTPAAACQMDNHCAPNYRSLPPTYRCSSCNVGFYSLNASCVPCPQSPWAVVVGIALAIIILGGLGWFLNKYSVNIGLVSIGVDFAQTLAIASNASVPWPPLLANLFLFFSAFNLNIEIVAPECFIQSVTFVNKFQAVIAVPLLLYGALGAWALAAAGWRRCVAGQTNLRLLFSEAPAMMSGGVLLLYLFYLYVSKTVVDIFTCVPTSPPDGNTYLISGGVSAGACGTPGSAQAQLFPIALFALVFYVIGFPAAVAYVLRRYKELIMEDQYLRAAGTGDDRLSNPNALLIRNTFGRLYFLFKPTRHSWILVILGRKFLLALVTLVFSSNTSFQLAASLVLFFLAYAAQTRYAPFMSADEHGGVIREHLRLSATDPLHGRLRATIAAIEVAGRKRGSGAAKGGLSDAAAASAAAASEEGGGGSSGGGSAAANRSAINWERTLRYALNYNTVDATMLFAGVAVLLAGILFTAVRPTDAFYQSSNDTVLGVAMVVVIFALSYWAFAMITDLYQQVVAKKAAMAGGGGGGGAAQGPPPLCLLHGWEEGAPVLLRRGWWWGGGLKAHLPWRWRWRWW